MIIKELELTHFGKFHGKKIYFEDGLNILHGKNEAGKSTIHTFIRCMFFGMDKASSSRTKKDIYTLYKPWDDQGGYGGTLTFSQWGKTYRIERSFLKTNTYLRLYNVTDNLELSPAKAQLQTLLGQMSQTAYRNTVSISQMESVTDENFSEELQNHVANLGASKSVEIDLAASEEYLLTKRSEYEKLIKEKADLQKSNIQGQLREASIEMERLITADLEGKKRLEADRKKEYKLFSKESTRRKELEEQIQKETERKTRLEHEKKRWHTDLFHLKERMKLNDEALEKGKIPRVNPAFFILTWLVFFASLLVGGFYTYDLLYALALNRVSKYMYCEIIAPCCIILWIGTIFLLTLLKNKQKKLTNLYQTYMEKLSLYEEACESFEHSKLQLTNLTNEKDSLDHSEYMALHSQNDAFEKDLLRIEWELEQHKGRMDALKVSADEIDKIVTRNLSYETEIEAIDLALKTLSEVAINIHDSFGKALHEKASYYLDAVTKHAYSDIVVDDQFHIRLRSQNRLINLEQLSRGTMEQVYLCIRLACADLLYSEVCMPIFLDDTFAYYDDGRTSDTLLLLNNLNRQVIVLTCHGREDTIMKSMHTASSVSS